MGQRRRDIWSGVHDVKWFWTPGDRARNGSSNYPNNLANSVEGQSLARDSPGDTERRGRSGGADRRERAQDAAHRNDDSRPQAVAQMRVSADRRGVQAARRDQPAAAAVARRAGARRGCFLIGQSCAGRGDRGQPAGHRGDDRDAGRCPAHQDRRDPRAGSGNRLLRPRARQPRGDRRQDRGGERRDGRAELRRCRTSSRGRAASGSRSPSSLAGPRAGSSSPQAGADCRRGSRSPVPRRRSSASSRKAGTTWGDRCRRARSSRSAPIRRRPCATRCRPRACRRSPLPSCRSAAQSGSRSARTKCVMRCALPGASMA